MVATAVHDKITLHVFCHYNSVDYSSTDQHGSGAAAVNS